MLAIGTVTFCTEIKETPEWASNIVGGNLLELLELVELVELTARLGGHLAPGIGDYPYRELGSPPNEDIILRAARIARAAGRELATPADAREMLGL